LGELEQLKTNGVLPVRSPATSREHPGSPWSQSSLFLTWNALRETRLLPAARWTGATPQQSAFDSLWVHGGGVLGWQRRSRYGWQETPQRCQIGRYRRFCQIISAVL